MKNKVLFALTAVFVFLLGLLASSIINRKNEAKYKYLTKVKIHENEPRNEVWANESWGRYWAWDPKETWALISIIVYAVVLHLRLIPKLKSDYVLNMVSMFAFWSIIMTSFGVNYYLTGLHSYASGNPVPIPKFVYVVLVLMIVISLFAYLKNRSFKKK